MTKAQYIATYNPSEPNPRLIGLPDIVHSREGYYYIAGTAPMIGRHNLGLLGQHVRELTEAQTRELQAIDEEIKAILARRKDILVQAFHDNPPVTADEAKGMVRK